MKVRYITMAVSATVFAACDRSPTATMSGRPTPRDAQRDVVSSSIGFTKTCVSPVTIGDPYTCSFRIINSGTNTLATTALSDVIHTAGGNASSGNVLSFLSLVFSGSVSCVGGSGSGTVANPYVGASSCSLGASSSINTAGFSHYIVQAPDYGLASHLLPDDASLTWNDTCSPDPTNCTTASTTASAGSSATVQQLSASVVTAIHNVAHSTVTVVEAGASVHDFVTVSGASGKPVPSGNVTVDWFTNGTCTTPVAASSGSVGPLNASGQLDVIGFAQTATAGARAFKVHYMGDATYAANDGSCEALTVADANVQISPLSVTNSVSGTQTLTGHVNINAGSGFINAPDGTQIGFNILSGPGSFTSANPCTVTGGTGSCTVNVTSAVVGTSTVSAHSTLSVAGFTLTRTTGTAGNSDNAAITWELPKPIVTVTKVCPNGKQSLSDRFGVALNGTPTGAALDCGEHVDVRPEINAAFTITEQASGTTTNLSNYQVQYSGCSGAGLPSGATASCTITNTLSTVHSEVQPSGYWKNHLAELSGLLPIDLGTFSVTTAAQASAIFDAMNCGSSKDLGVVGCLAGQLLSATLSVKNGASNCINPVIGSANALLTALGYQGPGASLGSAPTSAQRQSALVLKDALDKYNRGKGC